MALPTPISYADKAPGVQVTSGDMNELKSKFNLLLAFVLGLVEEVDGKVVLKASSIPYFTDGELAKLAAQFGGKDESNALPIVSAGADNIITLPTNSAATNNASASDSDGTIANYLWTKLSGPDTFTITTPNALNTSFTNLVQGVYVFRLTVTDDDGATSYDDVQVTVNAAPVAGSLTPVTNWSQLNDNVTVSSNNLSLITLNDREGKAVSDRVYESGTAAKVQGVSAGGSVCLSRLANYAGGRNEMDYAINRNPSNGMVYCYRQGATTTNTSVTTPAGTKVQLELDGPNVLYQYSTDGTTYTTFRTESRIAEPLALKFAGFDGGVTDFLAS